MDTIRLGVVGLGRRGGSMFRLAAGLPEVRAAAACDIDPGAAERLAAMRTECAALADVTLYDDYAAMLDGARLDAVIVETPATCHATFCAEALAKGVAVLSDIPVVASLAEGAMLWRAGSASRALFMTGANPNEWGFVEALADARRQGLLGEPYYLEAEYIHDVRDLFALTPWRRQFIPITYCTHSLGPLLRVCDGLPRRVSCVSTGSRIDPGPGQNDLMTAHFVADGGAVIRLTISFINRAQSGNHAYRVFGTEGVFERVARRGARPALTLLNSTRQYGLRRAAELPVNEPGLEVSGADQATAAYGHGGADRALLERFVKALRGEAEPWTLREGLAMTLPGLFAAESARRGGALVEIRYPWEEGYPEEDGAIRAAAPEKA